MLSSTLNAQENDFDRLLETATEHATQERLNLDYTPSVITVLDHDRMVLLGIKTLFEALSILPGVETSMNQIGIKKVIVRGFDNPNNFTSDKTKLLIDGTPIETAFFSNTSMYLNLPVDIIERVEVLRGPGSALYGSGAYNGVINVITRYHSLDANALFAGGGSYGYYVLGGRAFYDLGPQTQLHADAYIQRSSQQLIVEDNFERSNLIDRSAMTMVVPSDTPQSQEQLDDYSVGFRLTHGHLVVKGRLKRHKSGNYFGWGEKLEQNRGQGQETYAYAVAEHTAPIAPQTSWRNSFTFSRFSVQTDQQDYYKIQSDPNRFIPYSFSLEEEEKRYRFESRLQTQRLHTHAIETGVMFESIREVNNSISDDLSPYGTRALVTPGVVRDTVALFLRDTWEVSETATLFGAFRGDYYAQQRRLYPSAQFGAVFVPDDAWQFKLNYGHAFRVPSWVEQHSVEYGEGDGTRAGNPDLRAETTDTFEFVTVARLPYAQRVRFNTYYSRQHDVIDIDDVSEGYANRPDRTSVGVEATYDIDLRAQDHLSANFSWTDTTYITPESDIRQRMPTAAGVMIKGYYIHYFRPTLSLSLLGKYIGERPRNQEYDSDIDNQDIDSYFLVDLTAVYAPNRHWHWRFSLKNALDADVRFPSYYSHEDVGIPRPGRTYLVDMEYCF